MKECKWCSHQSTCTLLGQYLKINLCDIMDDINMDCSTDSGMWYEFSWNQYTENSLDYGEKTEWDKYLEEESLY